MIEKVESVEDRIVYHYKEISELRDSLDDKCDIAAIRILNMINDHEIAIRYLIEHNR